MSQYLPYGQFKWLNKKEIDKFDLNSIDGYVLEVDLKYPNELYEMHNDYALAPIKYLKW